MTKFLCWKRCDWCGQWKLFTVGWIIEGDNHFCTMACRDGKTYHFEGRDNLH